MIFRRGWFSCFVLMLAVASACGSEDISLRDDSDSASQTSSDTGAEDTESQAVSTESGTASATADTGTSDTGAQPTSGSDSGTGSGTADTGTHSSTKDTDTSVSTSTQVDTDPVGPCDVPNGFLEAPSTQSYLVFNAAGHLNDIGELSPTVAEATVQARYKGEDMDLSSGGVVAYYSSNGQRALFKMRGAADGSGHFHYAEAKITVFDLMNLDNTGEHLFNLYDGETQSTTRLYDAWEDESGNIEKLCLLGVPWINAFYYACTTGIDYLTNVGEPFSMAGNIEIYDDTDHIATGEYAMCLCDNGGASWRSCDEGIPDDYGLLRLAFRDGPAPTDYYSKYVFDESKLWTAGNALDTAYVGNHAAGVWRHTYSFMTGGLNILTRGDDMGELIYGFGEPIPYGSGVIGLVSHDDSTAQIIVREQSFQSMTEGSDPIGLWLIAYVPDDVQQGDLVELGTGAGTAKLFAYDPNDPSQCIQAIACDSAVRIQTASNLGAAEGGTFELRSEADAEGSRFSVRLAYPGEVEGCDIETYLAEAGLPTDAAICDKL